MPHAALIFAVGIIRSAQSVCSSTRSTQLHTIQLRRYRDISPFIAKVLKRLCSLWHTAASELGQAVHLVTRFLLISERTRNIGNHHENVSRRQVTLMENLQRNYWHTVKDLPPAPMGLHHRCYQCELEIKGGYTILRARQRRADGNHCHKLLK